MQCRTWFPRRDDVAPRGSKTVKGGEKTNPVSSFTYSICCSGSGWTGRVSQFLILGPPVVYSWSSVLSLLA
jgi:hypothetical protein